MQSKPIMLLAFILVAFTAHFAQGTVIYDNGAPNQVNGSNITAYVSADDFNLTTASILSGVIFWSSADVDPYPSQFSGTIGWGIFSDDGGMPGTLLFAGADGAPTLSDTGLKIDGTDEWQLNVALPSVALGPGTFWLALHEGPLGTPDDGSELYWDTTANNTGSVGMVNTDPNGAGSWFPNGLISAPGADLAFQLTGEEVASPEPSLLPFVFIVLIAGVVMRPKQRSVKWGSQTANGTPWPTATRTT